MLWKTIRLMVLMPGRRWSIWRSYRLFRRVMRGGYALLDVSSGFVYR